jgi:hypothetical protein
VKLATFLSLLSFCCTWFGLLLSLICFTSKHGNVNKLTKDNFSLLFILFYNSCSASNYF